LPTVLPYASRAKFNAPTATDKQPLLLLHLAHRE